VVILYFRGLIAGVVGDQKIIDPEINNALTPDWPLSRIDITLRSVLRCGTFELQKRKDVARQYREDEVDRK